MAPRCQTPRPRAAGVGGPLSCPRTEEAVLRRLLRTCAAGTALGLVAAVLPAALRPAPALAASSCGASTMHAVRADGSVTRWSLADTDSGTPASPRSVVAATSAAPRLLATDRGSADLFSVMPDGRVLLRRWTGTSYGTASAVASGWGGVRALVASGRGVLYALDKTGSLRWYRWTGTAWATGSGRVVATGWGSVQRLASGGDGVVYSVRSDGTLWWTSFGDPTTGLTAARASVQVGRGWLGLTQLTGGGDGLLYGLTSSGSLRAYNHLGAQNGAASWGAGRVLAGSWTGLRALTFSPDACSSPADRAESFARAQVGDPYVYGATGPDAWDCSGLTLRSWATGGVTLPRRSLDQYTSRAGTRLPYSQRRPGDLVFWSSNASSSGIYHVATYVGDGKVVSAPRAGQTVRVQDVWTSQLLPTVMRPGG